MYIHTDNTLLQTIAGLAVSSSVSMDAPALGFVDMGAAHDAMRRLLVAEDTATASGSEELATHILAFVANDVRGRMAHPLMWHPTSEAKAHDLLLLVLDALQAVHSAGCWPATLIFDGSGNNFGMVVTLWKSFGVKCPSTLLLCQRIMATGSAIPHPFDAARRLSIIMDPSHLFKKIRNNVMSSAAEPKQGYARALNWCGFPIAWVQWWDALRWDCTTNSPRVYEILSADHMLLDGRQKMRNHLADDVLDTRMLELMQAYAAASKRRDLDGTIAFIKATSVLLTNLKGDKPYTSVDDPRLAESLDALAWFRLWQLAVLPSNLTPTERRERAHCFLAEETWFALISAVRGFHTFVADHLKHNPGSEIVASAASQDKTENLFGQLRSMGGDATAPDVLKISHSMGATLIAKASIPSSRVHQLHCNITPAIHGARQFTRTGRRMSSCLAAMRRDPAEREPDAACCVSETRMHGTHASTSCMRE